MTDDEWKMYTFQVMQMMAGSLREEEFEEEMNKLRKAFNLPPL